jgi:phosphoribosylpyrophosphate synthetase
MADSLNEIMLRAYDDLQPHAGEFDAVVCAGDMHGAPIAGAVAAMLNKPLMIVCTERHRCCVSHIVTIGDCRPEHRYLYVDDWFSHGASLAHTLRVLKRSRRRMFRYLNQSAPANVTATYAATLREYKETTHDPT